MKTYLEPAEVGLLEGAARYLRDRLLVRVLFRLGCRISEALALRPGDVSFSQGTVTIQHLKARVSLSCPHCGARLGRGHRFCPGCGQEVAGPAARRQEVRRVRALPVDRETLEMLREYVDHPDFQKRVRRTGDDRLFGIGRRQAVTILWGLAERAGIPPLAAPESGRLRKVSPHRLRDAFAVHAMKTAW